MALETQKEKKMARMIAILMVIATGLLVTGTALVAGTAGTVTRNVTRSAADDFTVPPEFAGVWNNSATTTVCGGIQIATSAGLDTLCAGAPLFVPGDDDPSLQVDCTGTVNATTVDVTCTGSSEIFPDCQQIVTIDYDVTRTGDQSTSTVVITTTYVGTGEGCSDIPDSCIRTDGTGTRVSAAPGTCLQTPVTPSSWGVIKTLYGE